MFRGYKYVTVLILAALALAVAVAGCNPESISEPVEVVSALGPLEPYTPAGPAVEITLKNVSDEPVVSLTATLEQFNSHEFIFDVTPSNPLLPGDSVSCSKILITGAIGDTHEYPLIINATLQNGEEFNYTKEIQFIEPAKTN